MLSAHNGHIVEHAGCSIVGLLVTSLVMHIVERLSVSDLEQRVPQLVGDG